VLRSDFDQAVQVLSRKTGKIGWRVDETVRKTDNRFASMLGLL
jgi:hypothetical protein